MGFVCFQQMLYKKIQCSQLLPFNPPFRQGLNIFGFVMDTLEVTSSVIQLASDDNLILYDAFHLGGESTRNILCNCCSGTKTCLETTTSDSPSIQKAFKQSL